MAPMLPFSFQGVSVYGSQHVEHYTERAKGGTGLIIMQAISAKGAAGSTDLWSADNITVLREIVSKCHEYGAGIMIQLHDDFAIGQSSFDINQLSTDQIHNIQMELKQAANFACEIGFEGVEYHCVHGSALCRTIDASYNKRTDQYGGSFENRIRLLVETVDAIRAAWPADLPLFVRISATDWTEGGWDIEQSVELARVLKQHGVDLVDTSSGGNVSGASIPTGPGYQVPFAEQIRREAGVPTGAVGQITSPAQADQIILIGQADVVLLAREMLRDPYWPLHAAEELGAAISWPAQYLRATSPTPPMRQAISISRATD